MHKRIPVVEVEIDDSRIEAITNGVKRRIENLHQMTVQKRPVEITDKDDVKEDIAEDYGSKK